MHAFTHTVMEGRKNECGKQHQQWLYVRRKKIFKDNKGKPQHFTSFYLLFYLFKYCKRNKKLELNLNLRQYARGMSAFYGNKEHGSLGFFFAF